MSFLGLCELLVILLWSLCWFLDGWGGAEAFGLAVLLVFCLFFFGFCWFPGSLRAKEALGGIEPVIFEGPKHLWVEDELIAMFSTKIPIKTV